MALEGSSHILFHLPPQLNLVQDLARKRNEFSVEGEVYKWLGHCWSKLSDAGKAEMYFLEGAG